MTAPKKTPPQLPKTIKVHGVEFDFITDELEVRRLQAQWEDTESLGFFCSREHVMVIHPDQPELSKGDTSVHELLHAIWWQAGGRTIVDSELEEKIISLLSGPLFDVIRRNPEYINYLMSIEGNG